MLKCPGCGGTHITHILGTVMLSHAAEISDAPLLYCEDCQNTYLDRGTARLISYMHVKWSSSGRTFTYEEACAGMLREADVEEWDRLHQLALAC